MHTHILCVSVKMLHNVMGLRQETRLSIQNMRALYLAGASQVAACSLDIQILLYNSFLYPF